MRGKAIGIVVWALGLLLSLVLLFSLAAELNATVISTCIFTLIAFVGMLIFILYTQSSSQNKEIKFLHIPAFMFAGGYMAIQIPICILFALLSKIITFKITVTINTVIFILAWMVILVSLLGNNHIQKVNSRQKDHHVEL